MFDEGHGSVVVRVFCEICQKNFDQLQLPITFFNSTSPYDSTNAFQYGAIFQQGLKESLLKAYKSISCCNHPTASLKLCVTRLPLMHIQEFHYKYLTIGRSQGYQE